jgi:hypothetical protein
MRVRATRAFFISASPIVVAALTVAVVAADAVTARAAASLGISRGEHAEREKSDKGGSE